MTVRPLLSAQGVTLEEMIVEIRRELTVRRLVYPDMIGRKQSTPLTQRQDARLRAALDVLVGLADLVATVPRDGDTADPDPEPPEAA
jgi:hypothetical protein